MDSRPAASGTQSGEEYVSPVDFEALRQMNPDVCAWLEINGTDISYPVVQHPSDDGYYLDHGADGAKTADGALFTERTYNQPDFSDPVTIVYGHNRRSGAMFGNVQEFYSDADFFAEHPAVTVFLPDGELHYTVFAAVPYDNRHILYHYDFTNRRTYERFFGDIEAIRAIGANFRTEADPRYGERVLILSTCLRGKKDQRYLVCAALTDTNPIV